MSRSFNILLTGFQRPFVRATHRIGANAVVTRDVPAGAVAVGVAARGLPDRRAA
jgi:hypothetical protein